MNVDQTVRTRTLRAPPGPAWPLPVRIAVSLALGYHLAGVLVGAVASHPSSELERAAVPFFKRYFAVTNQGYGYRYYARLDTTADPHHPRPWGTPVVTADLEFDRPDGTVEREQVRLPARPGQRPWPRIRFQRQLDLAFHLSADPRWTASYARHLAKTRRCDRVTIFAQEHQIPDLALVRTAATVPGAAAVDFEAEATYSPRVKLGEFRCVDF